MSATTTEPLATTIDEPLARLVAFEPTTFPVLSVYLNNQPDEHGRAPDAGPYLIREFKALGRTWAPSSPERQSFDQDQELVPMVEVMKLDIHASEQDVLTATLEKLQFKEAKTAAEKVDRLMQQYRARGLAVVGPQETLEALANGQVEELLISGALEETHPEPEEVRAILAPEIPDSAGETKSEEPRQASLPDLLVTKAKQTGATVTFMEDTALLESIGGVGAFLRWRT